MSNSLSDAGVSVAALVAVEAAKLSQSWLPDLATVRKADSSDHALRADMIAGEIASAVVVLLIASCVSWATESEAPLVIALVVLAAVVGLYEWTYHTRSL